MLKSTLFMITLISFIGALADGTTKKIPTNSTIICEQSISENNIQISRIIINLDKAGQAYNIIIMKKGPDGRMGINSGLNISNATINHSVQLNKIEDYDEETNEPNYAWGIKDVEVIEAMGKNGDTFKLVINDHSYVGYPGSTLTFKSKTVQLSNETDGSMVTCQGKLKFPR